MTREEVMQSTQEMIFHLNYNTRYGGQSPFSNITLALGVPEDMRDQRPLIAGKTLEDRWGTNISELSAPGEATFAKMGFWQNMVAEAIIDNYMTGDVEGKGFTFPVLSVSVVPELFEHPLKDKLFKLSAKFGNPYYQNYINGHSAGKKLEPSDVRSMCCRLQIDNTLIQKHVGGLFGNGDQTGSLIVVTLNYPMIAMDAVASEQEDKYEGFMHRVWEINERIRELHKWKRKIVEESWKEGFFTMASTNLRKGFDTFYTTVGFVGLWETVQALGIDENGFMSERGMETAVDILTRTREQTEQWIAEDGRLYNFEATPAESAAYKLAIKMLKEYPDAPHRGSPDAPYLTNSCHIPVEYQDDVVALLSTQANLQPILSGGTVVHLHTGEKLSPEGVEAMVKTMCSTQIPYFSVSPVYSRCACCGRIIPGNHEYCPYDHTDEQIAALRAERPDLLEG